MIVDVMIIISVNHNIIIVIIIIIGIYVVYSKKNFIMQKRCIFVLSNWCEKLYLAGFHTGFFVGGGGGGIFWNSKIDIKHTFLGESRGMPPRKCFTNHRPEIIWWFLAAS